MRPSEDWRWPWQVLRARRQIVRAAGRSASKTGDLLQAWADRFERVLTKSSFGIVEALRLIRQQSEVGRVLLLVDQFEELFRFAKSSV